MKTLVLALTLALVALSSTHATAEPGHPIDVTIALDKAEYKLGEPIKVTVTFTNTSEREVTFNKTTAMPFGSGVMVFDDSEKPLASVVAPVQHGVSEGKLGPGETFVSTENFDLTTTFLFTREGTYTAKYAGTYVPAAPPSEPVTFTIKGGQARTEDVAAEQIIPVCDGNWKVWSREADVFGIPGYTSPTPAFRVTIGRAQSMMERFTIHVTIVVDRKSKLPLGKRQERAIYLGECDLGHVYVMADEDADTSWETWQADLATAMKIENK